MAHVPPFEPAAPAGADRGAAPVVFDLGELLTLSARPVVAQALARGHDFHYDHVGSPTDVVGDIVACQRSFHRVMCAALDLLGEGTFIIFSSVDQVAGEAEVELRLHAVATGKLLPEQVCVDVLERLFVQPTPAAPAESVCPYTGARLRVARAGGTGVSVQAVMRLPGQLRLAPAPFVDGEPAFLVHSDPAAAEGLAGRLRRLGWDASIFRSCDELLAVTASKVFHPPTLVVVFETAAVNEHDVLHVKRVLAGGPQVLYAVPVGSDAIGGALPDEDVRVIPLLPSELWDLSIPYAPSDAGASRPMPLHAADKPLVLVVDDNEVNLLIAEGLLRILGYATCSARDGREALDVCARRNPALVLMDIDMPVMNGYEATRVIRDAQRSGQLSAFPVVAVSAGGSPREAAHHGMDAYLPKPLLIGALRLTVERALKGLAPRPLSRGG